MLTLDRRCDAALAELIFSITPSNNASSQLHRTNFRLELPQWPLTRYPTFPPSDLPDVATRQHEW